MVKVSVIIPIYNGIEYIGRLLNCLRMQTLETTEVIIVDDGSTDGTNERLKQEKQFDFKLISQDHKGPSAARNLGIAAATGDYIRFMDADDYIGPDSCQLLLEAMEKSEADLVVGNFVYQDPDDDYYTGTTITEHLAEGKEFVEDFIEHKSSYYYGVVWNKLYRRSIIIENNVRFNETIDWCEDYEFNVDYYFHCRSFYYLNHEGGIYKYIRQQNSITKSLEKLAKDEYEALKLHQYEFTLPLSKKWNLERKLYLAYKFNELRFRLTDIVVDNGPSPFVCLKAYKAEMAVEGVEEYIAAHPMPISFNYYYFRGLLRYINHKIRGI